jgi:antitoxin ParD1/3/4
MEPAEKLSITLPASLARIVRQKVESGAYASNSEVIRDALRAWQEREMERERQLDSIRARLQEAADDPRPPLSAEEVTKRLDKLYEETVRAPRRRAR